jgi:hypothetical protein
MAVRYPIFAWLPRGVGLLALIALLLSLPPDALAAPAITLEPRAVHARRTTSSK